MADSRKPRLTSDYLDQGKKVHAAATKLLGDVRRQHEKLVRARALLRDALASLWRTAAGEADPQGHVDVSPLLVLQNPTADVDEAIGLLAELIPVATKERLGIMHYPVQIAAGLALIDGYIVQLATGEGKTIVGLYPEIMFGLMAQLDREVRAKHPVRGRHRAVHVMTANPLLAERDALWLAPVLSWFDLKTSRLDHMATIADQVAANEAEVVLGTAADFVFVQLREELASRQGERGTSEPFVLLVDEIDHAFVDEATLPFIITGNSEEPKDVNVVHYLGRLAANMAANPAIFVLPTEATEGVRLTRIGIAALDAFIEDSFEEQPAELESLDPGSPALQALMTTILLKMGALLAEPSEDGEGADLSASVAAALSELKLEVSSGEVSSILAAVFRSRHALEALLAEESLSKEDFDRMRELVLKDLGLLQLLRGRTEPAASFLSSILDSLTQMQLQYCLQSEPERLAGHLRACIALMNRSGAAPVDPRLTRLDQQLAKRGVRPRVPGLQDELGSDIDYYWIRPFFQVLCDNRNNKVQLLHRFLRLVLLLFARMSEAVEAKTPSDRELVQLGTSFGRLLSPTLFVFDPGTHRITLQPPGRALLKRYLKMLVSRDLWPGVDGPNVERDSVEFERFVGTIESIFNVGLSAHLFYKRDNDYVVRATEWRARDVVIVSELTGFSLPGRRWSGLLHSFLEHKEGLDVQPDAKSQNRISMQRFALRYPMVIGMSATAEEAGEEFLETFGREVRVFEPNVSRLAYAWNAARGTPLADPLAPVVVLSSNRDADVKAAVGAFIGHVQRESTNGRRPVTVLGRNMEAIQIVSERLNAEGLSVSTGWVSNRSELPDVVYATQKGKEIAVVDMVEQAHAKGMPILLETSSVRDCERMHELVSKRLRVPAERIQRLDARNEHRAAEILSLAGQPEMITVATQMAGRGVDIILQPKAVQAGGLLVVSTERRDSRRWDRQIAGRAARQGDPGFSRFFLSIDDPLISAYATDGFRRLMTSLGFKDDAPIEHSMIDQAIANAQVVREQIRRAQRTRERELDGELDAVRSEVLAVRALVVGDSHPCPGSSRHDPHPWVSNKRREPWCPRCQAGRANPARDATHWLRDAVRSLVADAIERAMSPVLPEEELVRRFASEGELPSDWDLAAIAKEVSELVGAPIKASDLGAPVEWRDRVNKEAKARLPATRSVFRSYTALKERISRRSDADERARLVNTSELWAPDVERRVLRARIRELLAEGRKRRFMNTVNEILKRHKGSTLDAASAIREALRSDPSQQWVDLLPALDRSHAEWRRADTADRLKELCEDFIIDHGGLTSGGTDRTDLEEYARKRLLELLAPLDVPPPDRRLSLPQLRRWAQGAVEKWYERLLTLGKPRLYSEENRLVRVAIDAAYPRFLEQIEIQAHKLKYQYHEDRIRSYQAVVADLRAEMRADIGANIITGWPTIRSAGDERVHGGPRLWPLPAAPCPCGSTIPYHSCCGQWLYGEANP
jgi:preprotein translocase subunit SecA